MPVEKRPVVGTSERRQVRGCSKSAPPRGRGSCMYIDAHPYSPTFRRRSSRKPSGRPSGQRLSPSGVMAGRLTTIQPSSRSRTRPMRSSTFQRVMMMTRDAWGWRRERNVSVYQSHVVSRARALSASSRFFTGSSMMPTPEMGLPVSGPPTPVATSPPPAGVSHSSRRLALGSMGTPAALAMFRILRDCVRARSAAYEQYADCRCWYRPMVRAVQ